MGTETLLGLALLTCVAYAWLLSRWLGARRQEALAGLPPAIGLGGRAVLRAQADPRTTLLAAERAGGAGPPLVLVHAVGDSGRVWDPVRAALPGRRLLVPDLLGCGASRAVGTRFRAADQAGALARLLEHDDVRDAVLVGDGQGAAVVLETAALVPGRVQRAVPVRPPAGRGPATLRRRLLLASPAYADGLQDVAAGVLRRALEEPAVPVTVVLGADDPEPDLRLRAGAAMLRLQAAAPPRGAGAADLAALLRQD